MTCDKCPLCKTTERPFIQGVGPARADIMLVGEAPGYYEEQTGKPFVGKAGQLLDTLLVSAGIKRSKIFVTNAVKCRPPNNRTPTRAEVKACSEHLQVELDRVQPRYILCMGNTALLAVTGHSGITKYRGKWLLSKSGLPVVATFHPAAGLRQPSRIVTIKADLVLFAQREAKSPEFKKEYCNSIKAVLQCLKACAKAQVVTYDLETRDNKVLCMSLTLGDEYGKVEPVTYFVPLAHPQSPLRRRWQDVMHLFVPVVERRGKYRAKIVGQNIKFDDKWFIKLFGAKTNPTFDTMLASHLIDENSPHDLGYLSRVYAGAPQYKEKVDRMKLDEADLSLVAEYNMQDSYYTLRVYQVLRRELQKDVRLTKLFKYVVMPGSRVLEQAEVHGMWVNRQQLAAMTAKKQDELAQLEQQLQTYVNQEINWNSSKQLADVLFKQLGLEVQETTATGAPSTNEAALVNLKGKHPIIELILKYREVKKLLSTYLVPWEKLLDENDRLHTTYKLHGTVTGRLASSDPNLQNVPRDSDIRSVIGAPPGWVLVEADYSQIELRLAAHMACEPTMLRVYQTGGDIHTKTACLITGQTPDKITKEQRKSAKAVNFGFVYGMGAKTFKEYAKLKYDTDVTLEEAEDFRNRFFREYNRLPLWHRRQIDLARRLGYVRSILGRKRRLPEINSPDETIYSLAARQAINSPVQSVPPDLTLLAASEIAQERGYGEECFLIGQVHDSIMFEVREDVVDKWCSIIKHRMENPPLKKLFGVELLVPIVAELTIGRAWGQGKEWTPKEVETNASTKSNRAGTQAG